MIYGQVIGQTDVSSGEIEFSSLSSEKSIHKAIPFFKNIKEIPKINEIVFLHKLDVGKEKKYYYVGPINVFNNINSNAFAKNILGKDTDEEIKKLKEFDEYKSWNILGLKQTLNSTIFSSKYLNFIEMGSKSNSPYDNYIYIHNGMKNISQSTSTYHDLNNSTNKILLNHVVFQDMVENSIHIETDILQNIVNQKYSIETDVLLIENNKTEILSKDYISLMTESVGIEIGEFEESSDSKYKYLVDSRFLELLIKKLVLAIKELRFYPDLVPLSSTALDTIMKDSTKIVNKKIRIKT